MILPVCSCGNILSNVQLPYERDLKELLTKSNITNDSLLEDGLPEEFIKERQKLLLKYVYPEKLCCKMKLMNFIRLDTLIN